MPKRSFNRIPPVKKTYMGKFVKEMTKKNTVGTKVYQKLIKTRVFKGK